MTSAADLPARELDAAVAREVMGWTPWLEQRGEYTYVVWQKPDEREPWRKFRDWEAERSRYSECEAIDWHRHIVTQVNDTFRPSTDWRAMGTVLDALKAREWRCEIHCGTDGVVVYVAANGEVFDADADSAPRAVALAALAAVGGK